MWSFYSNNNRCGVCQGSFRTEPITYIHITRGFIRLAYMIPSELAHDVVTRERLRTHEAGYLSSPKAGRTSRLSPAISPHRKAGKIGSNINERISGCSNKADELASRSKHQAGKKWGLPSPASFYLGGYQKVSTTFREGLPRSIKVIKTSSYRHAYRYAHRPTWSMQSSLRVSSWVSLDCAKLTFNLISVDI